MTTPQPVIPAPAAQPPPPPLAWWRCGAALVVAAVADTAGAPFGEAFPVFFDLFVALILMAITGFHPVLMPALVAECIPGVGLFPTWLAAVAAICIGRYRSR